MSVLSSLKGYKRGSKVLLLPNDRVITLPRLWIFRGLIALMLLSGQYSDQPIINIHMPIRSAGSIFGLTIVYWIGLRLLSTNQAAIEESESNETTNDSSDLSPLIDSLHEDRVTTKREIMKEVFEAGEYDDSEEWWEESAKPRLQSHPDVEQLDNSERRWQYHSGSE